MKYLERIALIAGLVVTGVTLAYRYLLTDEQREAVQEATSVLRDATQEVTDSVSPLYSKGPTKKQEREAAEENRARTAAQWEALGY